MTNDNKMTIIKNYNHEKSHYSLLLFLLAGYILEAFDMAIPRLTSYQRFIITVTPKKN